MPEQVSKRASPGGWLILVVGPSGVGKDTLLDGVRALVAHEPGFVFPRRQITRPATAGGEDHMPVSPAIFSTLEQAGGYALAWRAHGHGYGVPAGIEGDLAAGRTVVVNVSRTVLDQARGRFPRLRVISITADPQILKQRLLARGRETSADIAARLARADAVPVTGDDVVVLRNDGSLDEGIAALAAAIRA